MCERRIVGICCHDPPHGEAVDPPLRPFHTVSEGEFCELRLNGVLGSSPAREDAHPRSFGARFHISRRWVSYTYRRAMLQAQSPVNATRRKREGAPKARRELGPPRRSPQAQAGGAQAP